MKKQNLIETLHKPVSPVISIAVIIGVVLFVAFSLFTMRVLNTCYPQRKIVANLDSLLLFITKADVLSDDCT